MTDTPPAWTSEMLESPHDAPDKAMRVRTMFNDIAPRYQMINSLFSAGRDAVWRRRAVHLADVHDRDRVLDVACGSGELTRMFASAGPQLVTGVDFAHQMLLRAAHPSLPGTATSMRSTTYAKHGVTTLCWSEGDALRLPFASESFTIVSCAFGVRNFADLDVGLAEMHRILKPGGRAVILEFTRPTNRIARKLYEIYANRIMPKAATLISRDTSGAYRYLPRSVVSFAGQEEMVDRLGGAGFESVSATPLTMGVVTIYLARRP